jgi:alpha-1,3-rhamnosyl/mannosyltransferase
MPYRPGLPTVLTVYDLIAMRHGEAVSLRARLLFRAATWLALGAAQEVITISQATRDDLLAHFSFPADRVTAISLAADPRFTPQSGEEIDRVRQAYHLPDRYLLYLGINKPHKNLPRLIQAYARLDQTPLPPLVIAGAWDERYPQAKEMAHDQGLGNSVRFLGRIDDRDLPALYSGCLGFVFPSLYEGCGLPVLEAMACGAAVACGDRSSLPEVAGDAALLFNPTDVDAMAQALHTLIHDEARRRSLAQASLLQARLFSWERTACETLAVYRRLAHAG